MFISTEQMAKSEKVFSAALISVKAPSEIPSNNKQRLKKTGHCEDSEDVSTFLQLFGVKKTRCLKEKNIGLQPLTKALFCRS